MAADQLEALKGERGPGTIPNEAFETREVAAIVGGIYRLVDMGNTTTNVMGDMVGTAIVSHSEAKRL